LSILNDTGDLTEKVSEKGSEKGSEKSSEKILDLIKSSPEISAEELATIIGISSRAVEKQIAALKKKELLKRIGPAKGGHWVVTGD
jgi:ATP-dependent DNA helicase RecG